MIDLIIKFQGPLRKAADGMENPYSIEEALEGLASTLKVDTLEPLKCAERYTTGVSIFSSKDSDQVEKRIKRST